MPKAVQSRDTRVLFGGVLGEEISCFLAAAARVAAVQTLVAGACADHDHAAVVACGRVRLGIERQ